MISGAQTGTLAPPTVSMRTTLAEEEGPTLLERTADTNANVERDVGSNQIRARVAEAVDLLPDEQREVFLLR